ncbi:polysaccharide biosynthesis/export family protein, partial [bacterium]|nr:polysaccharide biosynthesis/export family protein [bacterium]
MTKSNLFLFVLGIGFIVVLLGDDTFAQSASLTGMEPGKTKLEALLLSTPQRLPVSETFFEGPVNPDVFELGPGDKLDIFLWRPTVTQLPVEVNAEGEAIIPAVGPVKVSGMSLAKAKNA